MRKSCFSIETILQSIGAEKTRIGWQVGAIRGNGVDAEIDSNDNAHRTDVSLIVAE